MNFDELLDQLGSFGRYQKLQFMLLTSVAIPVSCMMIGIVFLAATPDHWCDVSEIGKHLNLTKEALKNLTIPLHIRNNKSQYSQCQMYDLNYTTMTTRDADDIMTTHNRSNLPVKDCVSWRYDRSVYASSVVTQVTGKSSNQLLKTFISLE